MQVVSAKVIEKDQDVVIYCAQDVAQVVRLSKLLGSEVVEIADIIALKFAWI